jgi:hypothetical protein
MYWGSFGNGIIVFQICFTIGLNPSPRGSQKEPFEQVAG